MLHKFTALVTLLFAVSISLTAQTSIDQNSFLRLQNFTTGKNSVHLAHGDIDGDGKQDIVVANFGSNSVSILRNTSSNFIDLAAKIDISTSSAPTSAAIADLNGDGKPEIIVSGQQSYVGVFKNVSTPGTPAFESEIITPTSIYAVGVAVTDIDNDNYPDIAVINNQSFTVSIYSNADRSGGINLQLSATIPTITSAQDVIFANINADDKPDMVVTNYFSSSLSVYINASTSGAINFGERVDFGTEEQPHTVRAGDVDGDNKPDLVVGHSNITTISVLLNKGNGDTVQFAPRQNYIAGQTVYGIAIADLDNDGRADIATGNYSVNTMSVLMNNSIAGSGNISFADAYTFENINSAPYDLIALDIDSDGYKDLVTANFPTDASITVWYNNLGDSKPEVPSINSFSPISGNIGTTVTINGTGFSNNITENKVYFGTIEATVLSATATKLIVTVPASAAFGLISVVRNGFVSYSAFPFQVTFAGGGGGVVYNVDFFSKQADLPGNNPRTIKFADLDGDKKPDIVFTQQVGDKLSIYRNTSTEGLISYSDVLDLQTGPDPFDITINDFNGDGKPDIAITNHNAGRESTVMVYKNKSGPGNLSFEKVFTINAGSGANSIISADFNFDGKIDLGIAAGNSGYFYYLENTSSNSNISFITMEETGNRYHSSRMLEGDIDGDGNTDVITTNAAGQSITVNINDGFKEAPLFYNSYEFPAGQFPYDAAIGDIDGDGKQDIVVNNYGSNTVTVMRNISQVHAPAFEFSTIESGKDAMAVSLGDLDGDGKPEMIVSSSQPDKIGFYKNLSAPGKIEFGEVAYYQTGYGPTDIACGDLDGDGKTDLAIANGYSVVTILRNTFGEPQVIPSGSNPVYGAITQEAIYDSVVNTYRGQPYVQRHYEVTPVNNPNTATGTIKLYFRQSDFDSFNAHPDHGLSLPMNADDSAGIANLRVYQYHGTSSEGTPGTYSGSMVVIDPDDTRIVWNAETEWWEVSFEVNGFSGFFVSVDGDGMNVPPPVAENNLRVYPNPAFGRVVVDHPVSSAAFLKIIDMRGNVMRLVQLKDDASQTEIYTYGLATGIYKIVWQNVNARHVKTLMVK